MSQCPNCRAEVLSDALFCEACGHRLAEPAQTNGDAGQRATPGSLRAEIPLLSGAAAQIRARIEGMKERVERERQSSRREEEIRRKEESTPKRRSWLTVVIGVLILILWAYLLVRWPRPASPLMIWQLLRRLAGDDIAPADGVPPA
ncbi:MAG TPA: zinc ribbon domain-containing protein [Candidatus Nitrosotenuis sp.]|jgi:uncharacterized membrane protein YvbJ|nr:zinc ribbon domain-containing protein [Candidatus Nitrosotenuis sp.]